MEVLREIERQGWKVSLSGSGHWKCVPPDPKKKIVSLAQTPSDGRWYENMIAKLRRGGAKL